MSEDKKPAGGTKPEGEHDVHINLKVVEQDGSITYFKIKRSTQLKKLMMAYSERQGIPLDRLRFMYGGNRLPLDSTPKELNMEENDAIEVFQSLDPPSADVKPPLAPEAAEATTLINIKVVGPFDDTTVRFKIKRNTKMKKVMKAFCEQRDLPERSLRFTYDGVRLGEDSTPMEYEMEDDDTIEAHQEQLAGGH